MKKLTPNFDDLENLNSTFEKETPDNTNRAIKELWLKGHSVENIMKFMNATEAEVKLAIND